MNWPFCSWRNSWTFTSFSVFYLWTPSNVFSCFFVLLLATLHLYLLYSIFLFTKKKKNTRYSISFLKIWTSLKNRCHMVFYKDDADTKICHDWTTKNIMLVKLLQVICIILNHNIFYQQLNTINIDYLRTSLRSEPLEKRTYLFFFFGQLK